jgi:mRNA interferase YafQ
MLKVLFTGQFKRDYKAALKRGCDPSKLETVIALLCAGRPLDERYRDHPLAASKEYRNVRECHIEPDWLLIYRVLRDCLVLELIRTGTHSDLF